MGAIEYQIIDSGLLSGSSRDAFRTAIGGYWYEDESDYGTTINFTNSDPSQPEFKYFNKLFLPAKKESEINSKIVDSAIVIPNKRFPVRIAGGKEYVKDDLHWRALLLGGSHGENTHSSIYNTSVFQYLNFKYDKPYSKITASALASYASSEIQISYDYSDYLPQYEDYVKGLDSELLLPNYHILADLSRHDFNTNPALVNAYPNELINFVSLEGEYENINNFFTFNKANISYPVPSWRITLFDDLVKKNTNLSIQYLTSSLVQNPLSASTNKWAKNKLQTILFDQETIKNISATQDYQECLPFKIKIKFPTTPTSNFIDSINENNFSSRFIKVLYEIFDNKIDDFTPVNKNYINYLDYDAGSEDELIEHVQEVNNTTLREIDYVKFLAYCYNNYMSKTENCMFIGDDNLHRLAATSKDDTYRHVNTETVLGVLSDTVNFISNESNAGVYKWSDLFGINERHTEAIAYRVEKIGGPPAGDNKTQNILQNFWLVNSKDMADFDFFDSQVKFDTEYTYNVYAYMLTVGIKYNTSDLRLSRQLNCEDSGGRVGLEFYDPFSTDEESAEKLFDGASYASSNFDDSFGGSEFGNNERLYSSYPYLADLYLNYEPTVKVVEVPLYSKTLRVLDNPTNRLNVVPYQVIDSSQKVGFNFTYNAYTSTDFPSTISESDQTYKQQYMHANDLLDNSILAKESISKPRYLEVYRLSEKPKAITDFDGNLIATLDLKIKNSKNTDASVFYEAKVQANKKYYYLFRVLNQQRNLSHLTEIYETQLINDGGYVYAIFNVLFESELEEEIFDKTSKQYKKLFQLQPNLKQLQLNTEGVDFNQGAYSQINNLIVGTADDLIWNKTFKIRLTSKKTDRKIDLNITYYLNSE